MNAVPRRENDPKRQANPVPSDDRMKAFIRKTLEDQLKAKGMKGADALFGRDK